MDETTGAPAGPVKPPAENGISGQWRRARLTAELLRERLASLGVPPGEIRGMAARSDMDGRGYVHLGTLGVDSADLLLAALGGRIIPDPAP